MIDPRFQDLMRRRDVIEAIQQHALRDYPRESCGAVTPEGYVPLANTSLDPRHAFDCSDAIDLLRAEGRLLALVHSHPDGPFGPSEMDMRQQVAMDIPWGLVAVDPIRCTEPFYWTDDFDPPPLEGRGFRHGPSGTDGKGDCYALIRDWYRVERGIVLPPGYRSDKWWTKTDGDLYMQNYEVAGFKLTNSQYPEIGDIGLIQVGRAAVANHGCIYMGQGRILHHLTNQISVQDSFSGWVRYLRAWIRHD